MYKLVLYKYYNYILWQLNINIGRKNDAIQLGLKLNINK